MPFTIGSKNMKEIAGNKLNERCVRPLHWKLQNINWEKQDLNKWTDTVYLQTGKFNIQKCQVSPHWSTDAMAMLTKPWHGCYLFFLEIDWLTLKFI